MQAATVLSVESSTVTQVKTKEKDGYIAVQIGSDMRKEKFRALKEFKTENSELKKGDKISLDTFAIGDKVTVSSVSKGKGFQGVVKRHGFHGGPRSHGQKHSEREPGSIGGGGREGGKVAKGMRMAGRMGGDRVTIKNLKVLGIDAESKTMMVSGAVPGRRGTLIELRSMN